MYTERILLCNSTNTLSQKGYITQEIKDAIDVLGFDIYVDSVSHTEELLKIEFANQLGRLQDTIALNKFTELFKSIDPVYFVDPNNKPIL